MTNPGLRWLDPDPLRTRLERQGLWHDAQIAGRRWAIGCVSLEVTQRCNLDCTLCYLSDHAEVVRDLPLDEIFRRIDRIAATYGPDTDVQISGGEPTLRPQGDLLRIVRRIGERGMRASLFTNGIKASRERLAELAQAGLRDVAFHVDLTQERKGYATENDLDTLRLEYIDRARGLGLTVMFNTTVFEGNFDAVPGVMAFFARHADVVSVVSFQLQAATGRGVLASRPASLGVRTTIARLEQGLRTTVDMDVFDVGHSACNRYGMVLIVGERAFDLFPDADLARRVMRATADVRADRAHPTVTALRFAARLLRAPLLATAVLRTTIAFAWRIRADLVAARFSVRKLTLVVHNFMDACDLDPARVDACVFMVETARGPMSMCAYNAARDPLLLSKVHRPDGSTWDPLDGRRQDARLASPATFPLKFLKGRYRAAALAGRDRIASGEPPSCP